MQFFVDYLIIGSGAAGLFFANKAAERGTVAVVAKRGRRESNTLYAQGGIAAVLDKKRDSIDSHVNDTLSSGAGLCHSEIVRGVVGEGEVVIRDLMELGARFTVDDQGDLSLAREGGHEFARVVRADDMTGREVVRTLVSMVESQREVTFFDQHFAVDLLIDSLGQCCGARLFDSKKTEWIEIIAGMTLLSTGGCGQVFLHTTNPRVASGDGVAMGWRAGASVANMEFIQFHPTMFYDPGEPSFLITEALRGYGAKLIDRAGEEFIDPLKTRDIVSRAIVRNMRDTEEPCVYLDAAGLGGIDLQVRFPNIYKYCFDRGIDIKKELLPVVPAAHYSCGGLLTDNSGQTSVPGLYAAGEVSMTGLHGANRLASNSLLEAMVFARRIFKSAKVPKRKYVSESEDYFKSGESLDLSFVSELRRSTQEIMWEDVGIERTDSGLLRAEGVLAELFEKVESVYECNRTCIDVIEARNMISVARLITTSARSRLESRGCHYNVDHPTRDDLNWQRDTIVSKKD
ncbi:MAG: L-aspartate oxidase [Candidatus Latescibacterota bacterium]|nr:L-aspartate oxidase [Candidatus Latescibacterota bacterium]